MGRHRNLENLSYGSKKCEITCGQEKATLKCLFQVYKMR